MPAKKRRPGCLTKNGCMQKHQKPYNDRIITVSFRIIPYNTVSYRIMCLGTWQLQWANGGEGGMSTPGMQKHIHMLSQGVVVATSHTANIHNLSFHDSIMSSSLIASVIVSYMHSHNYKPQGLDTFSKFYDNTCVLGGGTLNHTCCKT